MEGATRHVEKQAGQTLGSEVKPAAGTDANKAKQEGIQKHEGKEEGTVTKHGHEKAEQKKDAKQAEKDEKKSYAPIG